MERVGACSPMPWPLAFQGYPNLSVGQRRSIISTEGGEGARMKKESRTRRQRTRQRARSIVVWTRFSLLSAIKTCARTVIAGARTLAIPDWRNCSPDRTDDANRRLPMFVAWLVVQRKPNPGHPYPGNEQSQGEKLRTQYAELFKTQPQ